jgi:site-specific recombinase XerD
MLEEIRTYLLVKESEGRAKSTLYEYSLYLTAFHFYCPKPLDSITNSDIAGWIVKERKRGLADASILARHRALKIFFNWCVEYELLAKTPLKMKSPKVRKQLPRVASLASVQKLLTMPADSWIGYRNRALVHLLFDTGMRIGEALSLQVTHINLDSRLVSIPPGKDGEGRQVPFTRHCAGTISDYLANRPLSAWNRWLFLGSLHGDPVGRLTTGGARLMLKRFCRSAHVGYINPHSIRHLFATKALNDGIRVEIVSRILGHASVDLTLRVYAKLLTETMQREYNSLWEISTAS